MEINRYPQEILEFIEAIQKAKFVKDGPGYEDKVKDHFPDNDFMFDQIDKELEEEFGDDYNSRLEIEVALKNEVLNEIPNLTRFESPQHKTLLNTTELTYRLVVEEGLQKLIPYHAILYTKEPEAEIIEHPDTGRPIIFFHGGLFNANLMFCKLYVQLITDKKKDNEDQIIPYYLKNDPVTITKINLLACYFHNYHFSGISKKERSYSLKSNFEKSILGVLLESIALFIYSHEVGHAYHGHHKKESEKTIEQLWKDEFIADNFAMNVIGDLYKNKEDAMILSFLGPIIYFKYRFFLEKYKPEIGTKDSHPPTMERLKMYYHWLDEVTCPEDKKIMMEMLALEHNISLILLDVFEKIDNFNKKA